MDDFAVVNAEYMKYFSKEPPARATIAVSGLPKGGITLKFNIKAKIEIEMTAV